jgi:hypothetical protein
MFSGIFPSISGSEISVDSVGRARHLNGRVREGLAENNREISGN